MLLILLSLSLFYLVVLLTLRLGVGLAIALSLSLCLSLDFVFVPHAFCSYSCSYCCCCSRSCSGSYSSFRSLSHYGVRSLSWLPFSLVAESQNRTLPKIDYCFGRAWKKMRCTSLPSLLLPSNYIFGPYLNSILKLWRFIGSLPSGTASFFNWICYRGHYSKGIQIIYSSFIKLS
jgi:hypothetical protein